MICNCGGSTILRQSVNANAAAKMKFFACNACGRISPDILLLNGEITARGWQAMEDYNALTNAALTEQRKIEQEKQND